MLPKLNKTDTKRLTDALLNVYPANNVKCDLRSSWSFDEETKQMSFGIICFVPNTINIKTTDLSSLTDKLIIHSTSKSIESLNKSLNIYTQHSIEPNKLKQIYITNLDKGEKVIHIEIEAKSVFDTIKDMDKVLNFT